MDLGLQGKHVLITGGSKGIGLACAQGFLAEGAHVSLVSRSAANLEAARAALAAQWPAASVRTFAADLRDAAQALAVLDAAEAAGGPVDVLVNSAGAAKRTPPDELTPQAFHDAMQAKYFTYIHVMEPLVKRMGARGAGAIVNVVGAGGKFASPIHMPGGAANAALMLVSAGMAAAYAPKGVRVNVVNPAQTLTERLREGMAADARMNGITPEEALQRATARVPLGRLARPEEIADVVVFLASPRAGYVTGAGLVLDGAATPTVT
ncbi:SDR family oxidoreductase [Ramlibacter sp. MAHUQ-53]|uniref:SDR family oxidoreductase n=1 Tax=unclassified Ramlibacter TaxID=2617605 RepID=UPI003626B807